ncbi:MAG: class I SAM-dependent methyltransferase [Nocardioides sp.]
MTPRQPVPEPDDASISANHRTVESYERIARDYADDTAPGPSGDGDFSGEGLRRLLDIVPTDGTVLEVGSGPGWDADFLESHGPSVRRTDITTAFIDLQAARGKHVERLDVTTDDLGGPYDAVLALAVLQHVERALLPAVLGRVAGALAPGGVFLASIRQGAGERWEVGDSGNPYFTVQWLEPDLCDLLEDAGLELEWRAASEDSEESQWLTVLARAQPGR